MQAVAAAKSYFLYRKPAPPHPPLQGPNAADAIIDAMCAHAKPAPEKQGKSTHAIMQKTQSKRGAHPPHRHLSERDAADDFRRLLEDYN